MKTMEVEIVTHNTKDSGRVDGRVKTAVLLAAIIVAAVLRHWYLISLLMAVVLLLLFVVRLSWKSLLRRMTIPFGVAWLVFINLLFTHGQHVIVWVNLKYAVLPVYREGLAEGIVIFLRIITTVVIASLLSLCTPMPEILATLRGLRIPGIIIDLAEMIYRYVFLIRETVVTMRKAQLSRCSEERSWLFRLQDMGVLAGNVLIKAMERSIRIYKSMLARGYDETAVTPPYFCSKIPRQDIFIGAIAFLALIGLLIADYQ
jgi:cobalt/nickel transport system permease protein